MVTSLSASVRLSVTTALSNAVGRGSVSSPVLFEASNSFANGGGAGQASRVWSAKRTLAAGASEDLDLSGGLIDAFGATPAMVKIKGIIIVAAAGNSNDVVMGGAPSNAMAAMFGSATDTVKVRPGALFGLVTADAAGYAVDPDTGDLLRIANGGGGTPVTYTIFLVGVADGDVYTPPVAPVGSTFVWIDDGLGAAGGGVGPGLNNAPHQFEQMMSGRLQPVVMPILAMSGTTIKTTSGTNYAWIQPYAIDAAAKMTPDVWVIGGGANDNLLSQDPSGSWMQDWDSMVAYAYAQFQATSGKLFVVKATPASDKAGETTWRAPGWAHQAAVVAALTAADDRVFFVPLSGMLPTNSFSIDTPLYVHIDERGAWYEANAVKAAIDARVQTKTAQQIRDMIAAGTYPLMSGAQLDTDEALAGTGGTVTGPGITGTIATSKAISNTTGATGISVAQVSTTGGRTKTVVTLAGNSSSAGKIMVQDKSNLSLAATKGQYIRTGVIARASAGFHNFGMDWNGALYGLWGGTGNSLVNNALVGAGETHPLDALIFNNDLALWAGPANFTGKRSFALFWRTSTALSGTMEFERWFAYVVSERTRHAPAYLGELANANGDRLTTTQQRLRPTGTVSAATGGTVTIEPGVWTPRGLLDTDRPAKRVYKGNSGHTAVGSGTLLGTVTDPATWTLAVAGGAAAQNDLIYVEVDTSNGIGGTVTARSVLTITVTA